MNALLLDVQPYFLEERRRVGADRWDEMWNGVLHMAPAPNIEHQGFEDELLVCYHSLCNKKRRGRRV